MAATAATEQIEPFFFGPPGRQLFGCYHEPQVWPAREQGVVLCYPFGQEYIRSHRACHHLIAQIARAGFPALRFDYYGTGDSQGEDADAHLAQWQSDLGLAVAELRARSGVDRVILAGLRLGASLALSASARTADLAGLVLWEPVVNGQRYLDELRAQHEQALLRFFAQPKDHALGSRPGELCGFALGEGQLAALEGLDLRTAQAPRGKPVLLIESQTTPDLTALHEQLQSGALVTYEHVPSFTVWVEDVDKGLVPQPVIEAITGWLDKVFA